MSETPQTTFPLHPDSVVFTHLRAMGMVSAHNVAAICDDFNANNQSPVCLMPFTMAALQREKDRLAILQQGNDEQQLASLHVINQCQREIERLEQQIVVCHWLGSYRPFVFTPAAFRAMDTERWIDERTGLMKKGNSNGTTPVPFTKKPKGAIGGLITKQLSFRLNGVLYKIYVNIRHIVMIKSGIYPFALGCDASHLCECNLCLKVTDDNPHVIWEARWLNQGSRQCGPRGLTTCQCGQFPPCMPTSQRGHLEGL